MNCKENHISFEVINERKPQEEKLEIIIKNNTRFTLKQFLDHKDYKTLTSFVNPSAANIFMIDDVEVSVTTYAEKDELIFTEIQY